MRTDLNRIKEDIETLASFTSTPSCGVTRLSYTMEDILARNYIKQQMIEAGLQVREDCVGTIIGRREGTNPDAAIVMTGSHFDTVKNGGAFDGAAGIVAALEAARVINNEKIKNTRPIEVVAMVEEEGTRFEKGMISSRAMAGKLSEKELKTSLDEDGISLSQAIIEGIGIIPDLQGGRRKEGSIKNFIELHIEQGPVLDSRNIDIGIVEHIVGLSVYQVTIIGKSGHAGTTPMNFRSDALLAASYAIIAANKAAKDIGEGTVATVGKIKSLPGASNVIPNQVEFSLDIRSIKEENIKKVVDEVNSVLKELEKKFAVNTSINRLFYNAPVKLSEQLSKLIEDEAEKLVFSTYRMNSGAGHDAMVMAEIAETGMIFVPSKKGLSHRPDEWTDYEDLQKGTEVLINIILNLTEEKQG